MNFFFGMFELENSLDKVLAKNYGKMIQKCKKYRKKSQKNLKKLINLMKD